MNIAAGCLIALVASTCAMNVHAHDFCVTNPSELRAALAASSDGGANQDEHNFIALAAGTYLASDGTSRFFYANTSATSALQMWGGFNADCSVKSDDASLTVLDGDGAFQVLVVRSAAGFVDILTLTVQNASTTQPGGGLAVNDTGNTSGDVYLRDLIIRNNRTSSSYGGFRAFAHGAHVLYFDNNLVVANSADNGFSAGALLSDGLAYARYDTIARNVASGSNAGGLLCSGGPHCELANDLIWDNSNVDLYLIEDGALYFNDIGVMAGTAPSINQHPFDVDPLFVDAAGGNFHPGDGSPVLGKSTYLDSATDDDLEGHPLPLTGRTDLGAYVDTIFSDGLD